MKKGFSLVEVLVSMTIFIISFASCISIYFITLKYNTRQEEYLAFENICYEIDKYSDRYNSQWNIEYFGNDANVQYYDENYLHLGNESDINAIKYQLVFYYEENDKNEFELIIDISEKDTGRFVIKSLNYGGARYE